MRDAGEFIVIVAAVCHVLDMGRIHRSHLQTEIVSHDDSPTSFADASSLILSYIDRICFGAGTVCGRACAALMAAFKVLESFAMAVTAGINSCRGEQMRKRWQCNTFKIFL